MRALIVARREFFSNFESHAGYVIVAMFPALSAVLFFFVGDIFFTYNETNLRHFFANMPILIATIAPAMAMRVWAEELRSGTIERLMTLPFSVTELVVGKFLGVWAIFAFALTCTFLVPVTADLLGDLDWGPVIAAYIGTLFMAGAALAICCYLSAITTSQIVAWILGAGVLLLLNLVHLLASAPFIPQGLGEFMLGIDMSQNFNSLARGVIDISAIGFYSAVIIGSLIANTLSLRARRYR
ncbi:MAG: ABC transporter permease subunit [Planctomycetes bacterium]|nr:ABC transporter permease subunit [Planctomycetota bacterium]